MADDPDMRPAGAGEALERLGRLSLRDISMEDLLQTVAELSRSVLPGDPEVSVTLLVQDRPTLMASTAQVAVDLDERQYERGHGPCLDAARTGEVFEVADARTDPRWRDYLPRAVEHGALCSLSIPLRIDEAEGVSGALNIYARPAHAFDDDSRAAAGAFAPYASVAAGNLLAYRNAQDKAENLQRALDSRAVIDQAKGVLVERYRLTPDRAFQVLARASMQSNRKVRDVAEHLVRTGELVGVPQPDGDRTP